MKIAKLRELKLDELKKKEEELKEELFNLRFQASAKQLESPIKIRNVRRDIARVKTLIGEFSRKKDCLKERV